ncbi:hypothetical protein [Streptosporangium sp. CA-115845]|uniref:hypothetical protein n=1 Tax=Streptosporangium sp. CA-115845 TaxID=3240071 RepID=UPI003D8E92C1
MMIFFTLIQGARHDGRLLRSPNRLSREEAIDRLLGEGFALLGAVAELADSPVRVGAAA